MAPQERPLQGIEREVNACLEIVNEILKEVKRFDIFTMAEAADVTIVSTELWKDLCFYVRGLAIMETLKHSAPLVHKRMVEFACQIDEMNERLNELKRKRKETQNGADRNV